MAETVVVLDGVTFRYDASSQDLLEGVSLTLHPGWTGVVGANGSGKTTFLELVTGRLQPSAGSVRRPADVAYCLQRTDEPSSDVRRFADADDGHAYRLRAALHIEYDWLDRWAGLSHGERKRLQVGACLWRRPSVLAVDEPTNHLDRDARELVLRAFSSYSGIGLLVSHDRELLDTLCARTLFVEPPHIDVRSGPYTEALGAKRAEEAHLRERYRQAKRELTRLKRVAARRRETADKAQRMRSKRGVAAKDHDAKSRIDLARLSGKDGTAGRLLARMEGRVQRQASDLAGLRPAKEHEAGVEIEGEKSKRHTLFELPAGFIAMDGGAWLEERPRAGRYLVVPELRVAPSSRIGVSGPNGSGKSTLVSIAAARCAVDPDRLVYIPQEVPPDHAESLARRVRSLSHSELGDLMAVISRLGTRPERVLETDAPSPGEVRKLMLALGLALRPHLVIMDEPTNHMDLPSIESIESALAEAACALLLVSHDTRFLEALTVTLWSIAETPEGLLLTVT